MSLKPLWAPSTERMNQSAMGQMLKDYQKKDWVQGDSYKDLHAFSIKRPDLFWSDLFDRFKIIYQGELDPAYQDLSFNHYTWFSKCRLNFAQNLLKPAFLQESKKSVALVSYTESGKKRQMSYEELADAAASLSAHLKARLNPGDVLGAYMPNIPETVVAMLATSSLAGVFTSTSCDFGVEGVVDRFGQSKPKVLLCALAYSYNGKKFDLRSRIQQIVDLVPSIEEVIYVDFLEEGEGLRLHSQVVVTAFDGWPKVPFSQMDFKLMPFSHPLYIMYSSGTTGKPKCLVHGQGGTLLQHVKELGLHCDLNGHKGLFYFTTCGWMMWNWLVSSLFFGAKVMLYEGSPSFPDLAALGKKGQEQKLSLFGTGPKFLKLIEDQKLEKNYSWPELETILSTGAPLLPEQFDFVYQKLNPNLLLGSISGGTDILGCFMLSNPLSPVYRGEIQGPGLGMDVAVYLEGQALEADVEGELVCQQSFPSRPLGFLNDESQERFKQTYFSTFKNVWYHGDFIKMTKHGGVVVYGRSDATLNPGGVRIGTAEIYRQIENLPFVEDSICAGKTVDGDVLVYLFIKLKASHQLSDEDKQLIKQNIKMATTPRHVPAQILAVKDIPYTRSGKKMELAVARLINGRELNNIEAVANPECLQEYRQLT